MDVEAPQPLRTAFFGTHRLQLFRGVGWLSGVLDWDSKPHVVASVDVPTHEEARIGRMTNDWSLLDLRSSILTAH
jgi:hypothetical protein